MSGGDGGRGERELRWGILGSANIGRKAVGPAIRASGNGRLVAVASRDVDRARALADELGPRPGSDATPVRAHGSYEALLDDPEVDAVYIPLPNALHRAWTVRAAAAGKHVLCEKPLALDADEASEMQAAAADAGVRLMEAFMYRFHPRTERAMELLRAGRLGRVRALRAAFSFRLRDRENIRLDAELGGGALMDVGCYGVNAARTLLGAEPLEAQAFARFGPSGVDEELCGTLRFGDGALAQVQCALTLPRLERVEVLGEEGRLELERAFLPGTGDVPLRTVAADGAVDDETVAGVDEYRLMVEHFADSVLAGRAPRYSAAEAAANLRAMTALIRSARADGAPQPVPQG